MTEDKAAAQDKVAVKKAPAVSPRDRAAQLEDELAEVRREASGQPTVRLKVEGPHSALVHNGITVGSDWTEVPADAAPAIMEGAVNSGVSLVQEEV